MVAIKALETGLVPPVPNFKEPDPELGQLNLSTGGAYPVRYALRLAAGFGSQIAMSLLRWTPMPDGRHRAPAELGYAYRIVDPEAWQRWLSRDLRAPRAPRWKSCSAGCASWTPATPQTRTAAAVLAPAAPVPAPAPVFVPVVVPRGAGCRAGHRRPPRRQHRQHRRSPPAQSRRDPAATR